MLRALNASITTGVTADDITGVWAGLRPLVKTGGSARTADLSRRHRVVTNEAGMITVTGGKLTTYREMAEDTVDAAIDHLADSGPIRRAKCRTKNLPMLGSIGYQEPAPGSPDAHLAGRYGTRMNEIHELISADPQLGEPLVDGLPYLRAEAVYAVRHEMARTLDDVLSRRTRARLFDRHASVEAAESVAALIAPELGWTPAQQAEQAESYRRSCALEAAAGSADVTATGLA